MDKRNIIIKVDTNKLENYTNCLNQLCEILNQGIEFFKQNGWIETEPTTEQLQSLASGDCTMLTECIAKQFDSEIAKIGTIAVKKQFEKMKNNAIQDAKRDFQKSITDRYSREWGNYQFKCIAIIESDHGKATFDTAKVKELASDLMPYNPDAINFIRRAFALFNEIKEFDNAVRLLSHNTCNGISSVNGKDAFIAVDYNYIDLDFTRLKYLDFDDAENGKAAYERESKIIDLDDAEISVMNLLKMVDDAESAKE